MPDVMSLSFAMKKGLSRVILSAAKNLKQTPDPDGEREILRCAQNDMSWPVFYDAIVAFLTGCNRI